MKKIIVANWKMQLNYNDSLKLARSYKKNIKETNNTIIVCPSHLFLIGVKKILDGSSIVLGSQDCSIASIGAHTGDISARFLAELGVKYSIIGHSERRKYYHENGKIINDKIEVAMKNSIIPILCIGESKKNRKKGEVKKFLRQQLREALKGIRLKCSRKLIVAYEPIWAIGGKKAIDPEEANKIHEYIKEQVDKISGKRVKVLYGGSVNINNAKLFLKEKNIDGLLIGGDSLYINDFSKICQL